jgi:hypothetical protein
MVALLFVVREKFAEYSGSCHELLRGEVLVAHHQHVMIDEGAAESGANVRVDRLGKVEANDFGRGVIRQGRDGEGRHGSILQCGVLLTERYKRALGGSSIGTVVRSTARNLTNLA